jgi:hypothetical protein
MAVQDKHPQYSERLADWIQMDDTFHGERAVKAKRLDYLPATEGMVQDGMSTPSSPGWKDYEAYLLRAIYHDIIKDGVKAMIGIMHAKPAEIKLPEKLEALRNNATSKGEPLQALLRKINVHQLVKGRVGLLVDVPDNKAVNEAVPYISVYDAKAIINWDAGSQNDGKDKLSLVVLDESGTRRKGLTWKTEQKFRVCTLNGLASIDDSEATPDEKAKFTVAVMVDNVNNPTKEDFITPSLAGTEMEDIPFVFVGANDLVPEPEVPPMLGLSNLALAIYRAEADYRQTLFLQGQQTLVIIGGNVDEVDGTSVRVGHKGVIDLKIGGDAKYIGASNQGLGEMRQSLENDKKAANLMGVTFLDAGANDGQSQSGEALRIRVAARTTTIASVAKAGGLGLENALKFAARWVGADPEEVSVKPITDFADQSVQGAALLAFMQAKQLGLPLSLQSIHRMMANNDLTEMSFDDEVDAIDEEADSTLGQMVSPQPDLSSFGLNPDGSPIIDPTTGEPAIPDPSAAGQPENAPGSVAPPNSNVPVTPHVRGSANPLKRKGTKKGASAE